MFLRRAILLAICLAFVASPVLSQGKLENIRQAVCAPTSPGSEPLGGDSYCVVGWREWRSCRIEKECSFEHWARRVVRPQFWPSRSIHCYFPNGFLREPLVEPMPEWNPEHERLVQFFEAARLELPKPLPGALRWLWRDLASETDKPRCPSNGFYVEDQSVFGEDSNPEVWKIADWLEANDPLLLRHEIVPDAAEIGIGADFDVTPVSGSYRTPIERPRDLLRSPALHGTVVGIRFRF